MIHFAVRFGNGGGQTAGVVFAGLDLRWLSEHLKERGLSATSSILIADREGNIWVGGTAPQDSILKFTRDGKLLWDFGHRPPKDSPPLKENNQQIDILASKGRFNLDEDAREIYMVNWKRVL